MATYMVPNTGFVSDTADIALFLGSGHVPSSSIPSSSARISDVYLYIAIYIPLYFKNSSNLIISKVAINIGTAHDTILADSREAIHK
jgi:hypothetical protein